MRTEIKSYSAVLALAALVALPTVAQDHPNAERGVSGEGSYSVGQIDAINAFTGHLTVGVPIGIKYSVNGNLAYGLTLTYNAQVWDHVQDPEFEGSFYPAPAPHANAGLGWQLSLGRMHAPFTPPFNRDGSWVLIEGDGSKKTFAFGLPGVAPVTGVLYTRDGSYSRMVCRNAGGAPTACTSAGGNTQIHVESAAGLKRIFAGALPQGSGVPGTLVPATGQLTAIEDPFGNRVSIIYFSDRWELRDSHGRIQQVFFAPCAPSGATCVVRVTLQTFGGVPADYTFQYTDSLFFGAFPSYAVVSSVLNRVNLPDGSSYVMTYHDAAGDEFGGEGMLASITLPTLGRYEYDYQLYFFGNVVGAYSASAGVREKRMTNRNGGIQGTWTYSGLANSHPNELVRAATDPEGNLTISYFGNYFFPHWQQGMPFSPDPAKVAPGDPLGRSMSTQFKNIVGDLLRTQYVRYTTDTVLASFEATGNQRIEASRTIYHDDGGRFADVALSDFDGLGHYRTTQTNGNFDAGNVRTESMVVNSGSDYDCPNPGFSCTGGVVVPPTSSPWLLNLITETRQSEGAQTLVQQYCFDSLGFQTRLRHLSGTVPGATDLLSVRTRDGFGNPDLQSYHGGDTGSVGTSGVCASATGSAQYQLDHQYTHGSLSRTAYKSGINEVLVVVDNDIDLTTGFASATRDSAGVATTFLYDKLGRLTQRWPADVAREDISYPIASGSSAQAKVIKTRKENSSTRALHELWYDDFGRLERERRNIPSSTVTGRQRTYNALGWLKTRSEWGSFATPPSLPAFRTTYSNFDAFGRPRQIQAADGSIVTIAYNGVREVVRTASIDGVSSTKTERFDRQGRLFQVTEPANNNSNFTTTYSYDAGNRLALVSQGIQAREFQYDGRGFLLRERYPEKTHPVDPTWDVIYSLYDSRGHALQVDDGGRISSFVFDPAERLTEVWRQPGNTLLKQFVFETANNGTDKAQGKLRRATRNNYVKWIGGGADDTVTVVEYYEYRGRGGRVDRRDTRVDWFEGATQTHRFKENFSYTILGDLDVLTYPCLATGSNPFSCVSSGNPGGTRTVDYGYSSSSGFLTSVWGITPAVGYASSISYHPNLELARVEFPGFGAYHRNKDPHNLPRPGSFGADFYPAGPPPNPANPVTQTLTYDGSGNVATRGPDFFDYDKANRLKLFYMGGPQQQYLYDEYGNLTSMATTDDHNGDGVFAETNNRSFNYSIATNRLNSVSNTLPSSVWNVSYNHPGEVTRFGNTLYEWDHAGMMTQLKLDVGGNTNGFRYIYTADDERLGVRKWTGTRADTRWYLRDLGGQVLREYLYEGTTKNWVRDYTYQNGLMLTVERQEGQFWTIPDHLGTPIGYQNSTHAGLLTTNFLFGYGEDRFNKSPSDIGSPKRFTGHERDQNLSASDLKDDLDYMHARYYSPTMARFLRPDPVLNVRRSASRPLSWNRYSYAVNNPLKYVDPTGETFIIASCAMGNTGLCGQAAQLLYQTLGKDASQHISLNSKTGVVSITGISAKAFGEQFGTFAKGLAAMVGNRGTFSLHVGPSLEALMGQGGQTIGIAGGGANIYVDPGMFTPTRMTGDVVGTPEVTLAHEFGHGLSTIYPALAARLTDALAMTDYVRQKQEAYPVTFENRYRDELGLDIRYSYSGIAAQDVRTDFDTELVP